ncbi:MAG: hypothetical protein AAFZ07_01915 [Actinomycetota bacterium]
MSITSWAAVAVAPIALAIPSPSSGVEAPVFVPGPVADLQLPSGFLREGYALEVVADDSHGSRRVPIVEQSLRVDGPDGWWGTFEWTGAPGPHAWVDLYLPEGEFVLRLEVTDQLGRTDADSETVVVVGDDLDPPLRPTLERRATTRPGQRCGLEVDRAPCVA